MAVNKQDFEVTDTSPPPKSSIFYSGCGAQTIATECLVIPVPSARGRDGRGETMPMPPARNVYRMCSSSEKLDRVLLRHSSRASPNSAVVTTFLRGVQRDVPAIQSLISNDPMKTLKEKIDCTKESKQGYLDKIQSFLKGCQEMAGGIL